ncbi:LPXTG cell wall anchor domain-containing protein [Streptococcus henryi]|uniref:LPXTG cell wall anchor domain-containing protein n=1 Tax=Streptococcus henryi TaxID=439219 RepID=UPI00036E4F79|nr:LPXTG cell wall anchor domain-containing protein [Streptococcus henryi]
MKKKKLFKSVGLTSAALLATVTLATSTVFADNLTAEEHIRIAQSQSNPDATYAYVQAHPDVFGDSSTTDDFLDNPNTIAATSVWIFNDDGTYYKVIDNVTKDTPVATETPTTAEPPATTETPVATEPPAITDAPVATETPAITDIPVAAETPATTDTPVATETPSSTEVLATSENSTTTKTSAELTVAKANKETAQQNDVKNQLPHTGESNTTASILSVLGMTMLLSMLGFKAYRRN